MKIYIIIIFSIIFLLNCTEDIKGPEEYFMLSICPEWSPDSTRIAFIKVNPDRYHSIDGIWMVKSDGTNLCKVIDSGVWVRWSKDGKYILYGVYIPHTTIYYTSRIDSYSIDSTSTKLLLPRSGHAFTWDYNNEWVYFNLGGYLQGIGRANVDWIHSYVIADSIINPDVSLKGDLIACVKPVDIFEHVWEIVVIDSAGTIKYHTNAYTGRYTYPRISPNSDMIVFEDEGSISIMNIDGSDRRVVASGRDPSWVPNGDQIVFCKNSTYHGNDRIGLWVVNVDGTNEIRIY